MFLAPPKKRKRKKFRKGGSRPWTTLPVPMAGFRSVAGNHPMRSRAGTDGLSDDDEGVTVFEHGRLVSGTHSINNTVGAGEGGVEPVADRPPRSSPDSLSSSLSSDSSGSRTTTATSADYSTCDSELFAALGSPPQLLPSRVQSLGAGSYGVHESGGVGTGDDSDDDVNAPLLAPPHRSESERISSADRRSPLARAREAWRRRSGNPEESEAKARRKAERKAEKRRRKLEKRRRKKLQQREGHFFLFIFMPWCVCVCVVLSL